MTRAAPGRKSWRQVVLGDSRCLVTENIRDFAVLARQASHGGLLFVDARRWPRTPAAIEQLADALSQAIATARLPGPGEVGWLYVRGAD